ncbi:Mitochondrial import receptor subunit TOM70 [Halotydeus destructor]|nr:Mitochondrial import receptor subunit TOM70 [Halotydeus destructor]
MKGSGGQGFFYADGQDIPKWQLALLIGAPIVIGVGTYWYFSTSDERPKPKSTKKQPASTKSNDAKAEKLTDALQAKVKGNDMFKQRKYEAAIDFYSQAIRLCDAKKLDDLATFYQNRAASYEMIKRYKEVIDDCTEAIKYNKQYTKALLRRAKAHEALGDLASALNDITAVCILEQFQNQPNLLMTDRLLRQQSKLKAKAYVMTRKSAMPSRHFMRHYFTSYIRDPLVKDPRVDENFLSDLMQEIEANAESPDREAKLCLLKGTIEILKGNIEEAEKELEKLESMPVADSEIKINALIKLGTLRVHDVDGNSEGLQNALHCFEEAIKLDPGNPDIYIHRAQIYLLSERVEEAKEDLEKCCSLSDSFPSAVAQKLYVQFRFAVRTGLGTSLEQAINEFDEAVKKYPQSSEVHSLYAQSLMEQQNFDDADKYFLKAIKCDPEDANLYVHRAILKLQSANDTTTAINLLEHALQVDDRCQFAYEMLGSLEVQCGNLTKALRALTMH